jgi:hypothetical protein
MRRKQIAFSTLVTLVGFLVWTPTSQAQQVPQSRHWVVEAGPRLVQISSEGIHINQPDPKGLTYYGIVSTHIDLPFGKPWRVDFDVKFGQLRSAGVGIGLFNGPDLMGWVGADGWYKQMGCFVGKSNEVAAPQANTDWHKFEFSGDGTTVSIKEDGNVIGSGSQLGTPNTIKIGDINGSVQPAGAEPAKMLDGQQSEITVRNVQIPPNIIGSPADGKLNQPTANLSVEKPKEVLKEPQQLTIINSNLAVIAKFVTIKYVYGMAGFATVGTLSQTPGIWSMNVTLQNTTDKPIWVIPTTLAFDDKSLETVLPIEGWRYVEDSKSIGGAGWGADMTAKYYTPTLESSPFVELDAKETTSFDVFAEDGGSWKYVTQQTANGYTSYPQKVSRNPKELTLLQLSDTTDPSKPTLEQRMASPFGFSPLPTEPYARNLEMLHRVQRPPSSDSRWIAIPLSKINPVTPAAK